VAPTVVVLVDHASQPAQVHRLRCLGRRQLRHPGDDDLRSAAPANLGTLVGAVCFLIGALLLPPERTEDIQRGTVSDHNDTRKRDGP
jgi:hypothetical protein